MEKGLYILPVLFVAIMHVVEGRNLGDSVHNPNVTSTDRETLTSHIPFIFDDDVTIPALTEAIQCEENMTMNLSNNIPSGESEVISSSINGSYAPNKTSQLVSPNSLAWYVIFKRVEFASRGIFSPIAAFLAFIGNTLFIVILSKGYVKSNSYTYLLALACSDLSSTILFSPYFASAHKSIKVLRSYQTFYAFYVSYVFPLGVINRTSGIWILLLFTIERFVAVTFPMKAQRYSAAKRSRIAVFSAVVFGVALNFVRFFRRKVIRKIDSVTSEYYYSYTLTELAQNKTYDAITFWSYLIFNDVFPFSLLLIVNTLIIHRVWRARFTRMEMSEAPNQNESATREHQITRLLIAIVVGFLVCSLFSCIASMYAAIYTYKTILNNLTPFLSYIFLFAQVLSKAIPLVNCILYAVCNDAMRNGIISVIFGKKRVETGKDKPSNAGTVESSFSS